MEIVEPYKVYIPSAYINNNYNYSILENYIQVKTNQNCHSQYNTTYCDCFNVYKNDNFIISNTYECNINQNVNVSRETLTSDVWYSPYMYQSLISTLPIFFLIFITFRFTIFMFRKAVY